MNEGKTSFITVDEEGSVSITGGLIFHPYDYSFYAEKVVTEGPPCQFIDMLIYTKSPKWWEIRKWWKIIQLIRSYTK